MIARTVFRWSARLIGPIARGQETRADRSAAAIAGGSAAASALVKVARSSNRSFARSSSITTPMTPTHRTSTHSSARSGIASPSEVHTAMRLQLLANGAVTDDPARPSPPARPAFALQSYPDPASVNGDGAPGHFVRRRPGDPRADAP